MRILLLLVLVLVLLLLVLVLVLVLVLLLLLLLLLRLLMLALLWVAAVVGSSGFPKIGAPSWQSLQEGHIGVYILGPHIKPYRIPT